MLTAASELRLTLICRQPRCGLREISIPLSAYEQSHGVDCDRCGAPMECIAAGTDRLGGGIIWFDVEPTATVH